MIRREEGFTLIELAVAVAVFGITLVGLSFVFRSSLTTAGESRYGQLAKGLAQEKLEELRSLPFYVSFRTSAADADVLDRYFPRASSGTTPTGAAGTYDGTTNVWSYTSRETVTRAGAPPFTRSVTLQFVAPQPSGTLVPRPPITGYDSDQPDLDRPATDGLKATVTVSWTARGRPRSVSFDSFLARTSGEAPKVEASASAVGLQVSGMTIVDGSTPAEVLATVGRGELSFREVTDASAQASADSVDVVETTPNTNQPLQPEVPDTDGSSSTAPNVTTGDAQTGSSNLAEGLMQSVNEPRFTIASWGSASPAAVTEARVSRTHFQTPETRAQFTSNAFALNARPAADAPPLRMLEVVQATGSVEQRSTTTSATATGISTVADVSVWGSPAFESAPGYAGVVRIESVTVSTESRASSTTASSTVVWQVTGLRVWDPDARNPDGSLGAYVGPWTFGFDSACGGWVDTKANCDGSSFSNPNPIVLPQAYGGTDGSGNESSSLVIITGATVRESDESTATGSSSSSAGQKNVLSLVTRDDIAGAVPLEPMLVGLAPVNTNVSYVAHGH